ncbi:MAG: hypothetical protein Q9221_004207 [Calogaya cf. arnoldii]
MEHARGVQLHQKWPMMNGVQKLRCIKAIASNIQQIAALDFPAYGSLYSSTVRSPHKIPLTQGYGRQMIHKLGSDARIVAAASPTLHHADLHKRNIFVLDDDPTVIADIIDWQSSSIEPAFEYANETPDFAALPEPQIIAVENPVTTKEDQPDDETAKLCYTAYDALLQGKIPKLASARHLDHNLLRPFRYCHRTWVDGAVILRQEMIETATRWKELGLPSPCPYPVPTAEALRSHQQEYKNLLAAHKLRHQIMEVLDVPSDGWVPSETWSSTKDLYKHVFETCIHAVNNKDEDDDDLDEEKLRNMWPFDIPDVVQTCKDVQSLST